MADAIELALRQHIRELLDDYVYTHLTVDHVEYSNWLSSEALSKVLKPIPTHGPGEIFFPVDPFESLKAKLKFDSLPPYDEVWHPNPDAVALLKETYMVAEGKPKSQSIWQDEDETDFNWMPHRPMTPLLSRSSLAKTPSLGKGRSMGESLASTLLSRGIRQIVNEDLPEEKPPKLEDCLDLKLTIDASTHQGIVELQKKTPFLNRPVLRPLPVYAAEYLHIKSPKYQEKFRLLSPPIFSRERRDRPERTKNDGNILGPIRPDPVNVQDIDQDFATESMKVIDGWMTLPASDSTPSLSSGTSEVDELDQDSEFWKPSSPSAELTGIETLESIKMEAPLFPRSEYPRSGRSISKNPRQSLSSFIASKIPAKSASRILTSPKSDDTLPKPESSPRSVPNVSLSMLGQPPSEEDGSTALSSDSHGDRFCKDLRRILKVHNARSEVKSYQDIIMDERLDEKETMFMDVPKLPPPNEYLREMPNKPSGKLRNVTNTDTPERPILKLPIGMKKITGVKSLNLELSWRPFSFGSKIPTHAELVGVDSFFPFDNGFDDGFPALDSVHELLFSMPFTTDQAFPDLELDPRILKDVQAANTRTLDPIRYGNVDEDIILLSRSDRYGLGLRSTLDNTRQLSDENLALDGSHSNDTSDLSSAITPELENQVPLAEHANQTGAYEVPFAYHSLNHISDSRFDDGYNDSQQYTDYDAYRYMKKRRLTPDELDALCAMETMSQSVPATINPKDLMLPQSNNASVTQAFYAGTPASTLSDAQQLPFVPSQSRSLSLSLNEFNTSQDTSSYATAEDAATFDHRPFGPYCGQNERPTATDDGAALQPDAMDDRILSHSTSRPGKPPFPRNLDHQVLHSLNGISIREAVRHPRQEDIQTQPATAVIGQELHRPTPFPSLLSDRDKLLSFLVLRGKQGHDITVTDPVKQPEKDVASEGNSIGNNGQNVPFQTHHRAPEDLLTATRAFVLPDHWGNPTTPHTYLVSLDLAQQRRLVCSLSACSVRLVERDTITPVFCAADPRLPTPKTHSADISIIVGPHSGVVFFPLSALPSQSAYKTILDALSAYSWRFSSILLVLMAFPRSQLIRAADVNRASYDKPSSYSPPAIKAARRVRRDLALRDGTGEKRTGCAVELSFADDVEEAAKLVRAFGDLVLQDSPIDFNAYIGEEEQEGENDLAEVAGMNAFCAAVILQCCTLEEFLEMPPHQRTEGLSGLIGVERIEHVNTTLKNRISAIDCGMSSSSFVASLED